MWNSPLSADATGGHAAHKKEDGSYASASVSRQMRLAHWPTPTVADVEGGRKTRSARYRVRYTGGEAPASANVAVAPELAGGSGAASLASSRRSVRMRARSDDALPMQFF